MTTTILESRFEQVLAEILRSEEDGTPIDLAQAVQTYPDFESQLREYFRDRAHFDRLAPCLAPTPPPGGAVAVPPELSPGSRFGGYEIITKLGHGGMGIVYHARQLSPEREVALKVIRTDRLAELSPDEARQWVERFRREAQVVASLEQHTNIVTVYEVGEHDGRPFFTMQLVRGGSLAAAVDGGEWAAGKKEIATRAAELVAAVARAVDYVHQRGVLHRDLKPGNILMEAQGRPLVSDFGLARRLDQSGSLVAGAIEGTAEYMAPEQARGLPGAVTTAADVYSLGAVLYSLLTGRPPFKGANYIETLMLVMEQRPPSLRGLRPSVPLYLEIICLKCLEKEPGRRYASAAALADDLENWLAGRVINARPANTLERTWRWCRRNPAPAVLASALLVSMIVGTAASSLFAVQSAADTKDAKIAKGVADDAAKKAQEQERIAKQNEDEAIRKERLQRRRYYISRINLAQRSLDDSLVAPTLKYLNETIPKPGEEDFRGFEWHYLDRQCRKELRILQGHSGAIWSVRYSPDGKLMATVGQDGTVRIWDAATSSEIRALKPNEGEAFGQIAFSPDGKRIAATSSALSKGTPFMRPDGSFMSPDERIAAAALLYRPLIVWDVETWREVPLEEGRGGHAVAFSPNGLLMATHRKDGVAVLNSNTGAVVQTIPDPDGYRACLAFSPDNKTLAYGGIDKATGKAAVTIWDLTSNNPRYVLLGHRDWIQCVAFNPQGDLLASGSWDGTVRLWDTGAGNERSVLRGFKGDAYDVAFNPRKILLRDGQSPQAFQPGELLCACNFNQLDSDDNPRTAQIWSLKKDPEVVATLKGHLGTVMSIAFSPRDDQVASAGLDGTVRVWQLADVADATTVFHSPSNLYLASSEKGAICAFGMYVQYQGGIVKGRVQVRDLASGKELIRVDKPISNLAMSADGTVLAIASPPPAGNNKATGEITLLEIPSGATRRTMSELPSPARVGPMYPRGLALSSDGKLLASAGEGATILIRDTNTGNELYSLPAPGGISQIASHPIAFHPKASQLVCINGDEKVHLWDLEERRECLVLSAGKGFPFAVSFSPDGEHIAIAECKNGPSAVAEHAAVRVRKVSTGEEELVLKGHNNYIWCLAFHPDGRRFVTGSDDHTAKIWDLETGQELLTVGNHTHGVHGVAFTGDGNYLLTAEGPIGSSRMGALGRILPRLFTVKSWNATPHPSRAEDEKLLAVLSRKSELGSAKELMELARFATHSRGKFAATSDLFVDYLGRRPDWASYVADEPPFLCDHPSYYAAASALMAARGEGDGAELHDEQRAALRKQALTWMREHLAFCEDRSRNKDLISQVHGHLTDAGTDGWFDGVRDEKQLANVPEPERSEWRQLWADLVSLREKCKPESAKQLAKVDETLSMILAGKAQLGTVQELIELARTANYGLHRYVATSQLFVDCLKLHPDWASYVADEPPFLCDHPSYYAAESALMAARGEGDGAKLTDEQRVALRKQALTWMREHLAFCEDRSRNKDLINQVYDHLTYASSDGWFDGVRDEKQLANVPEPERSEWSRFWTDLASLREKCMPESAKQLAKVDERLSMILAGKAQLGTVQELIELARTATHGLHRYAATSQLFVDSLKQHPDWASYVPDKPPFLGDHPSYYAAASALMAARGEGDGAKLTDEHRAALRKQALTWMREHLAFCENRIRNKGLINQVYDHLTFAASDGWFAGVRDENELNKLPDQERKDWTQLWSDLAGLREKCKPSR
jgi:WD40 repeat protein